jgi:hypothetical protein
MYALKHMAASSEECQVMWLLAAAFSNAIITSPVYPSPYGTTASQVCISGNALVLAMTSSYFCSHRVIINTYF